MIIRENPRNNHYHKLEIMILHVRFKQIKKIIIEHNIRTLLGITHGTRLLAYL